MHEGSKRKIIDVHVHLYDSHVNRHAFLEEVDPMFEALVGDYAALPRRYMLGDYLSDVSSLDVQGVVWNEFLSDDSVREVLWAQRIAMTSPVPMALVGLVDFLAPDLAARLDTYTDCSNVSAVRQHLGWDQENPRRRFAKHPHLLDDLQWLRGLDVLERYRFKCSLEVFSPQLPDLLTVVRCRPNVGFTIAVMGWPGATDEFAFQHWKKNLAELSRCENVRIVISAVECILGMRWSVAEARPWIETVLDLFGTERTMFGSHHPICGLSTSFPEPYAAYERICSWLSEAEQDAVFRLNAERWFFSGLAPVNDL